MKSQVFSTTAIKENFYTHFGIHPTTACLYGHSEEEIIELDFTIADDQSIPIHELQKDTPPDYWGWYNFDQKRFSLIFPQRFLLNMCFPYGIKVAEGAQQGQAYRIKIIES